MGSWNGTCAISKLPIKSGDKIKLVVTQATGNRGEEAGFCYISEMSKPISMIINGTYNDYGGIDNIEDNAAVNLFLGYFNSQKITGNIVIEGEDNKSINSIDTILEYIERDKVQGMSAYWNEETDLMDKKLTSIGFNMFLSSVVDSVSNSILESNEYFDKNTTLANYIDAGSSMFNEVGRTMDIIEAELLKARLDGDEKLEKTLIYEYAGYIRAQTIDHKNPFSILVASEYTNSSVFSEYIDGMRLLSTIEYPVENKINELIYMAMLLKSMNSVRCAFGPVTGKGSQSENYSQYEALYNASLKIINEDFMDMYLSETAICIDTYFSQDTGIEFSKDSEFEVLAIGFDTVVLGKFSKDYATIEKSEFLSNFEI